MRLFAGSRSHLNFSAFEQVVQQVLSRSGYSSIHLSGRAYSRGRTLWGGLDMTAYASTDLASTLTIVQVKQYQRPVSRRFVDELRGTMLRIGAQHGLLITTSTFSKTARSAANCDELAPIRLVDGRELVGLLMSYKIGIRQNKTGRWKLDLHFFKQLQLNFPDKALDAPAPPRCKADTSHPISNPACATGQSGGGMTWSSHVLTGINSLWLIETLPQTSDLSQFGLFITLAAFGALLPDLDAAESKIKHLRVVGIKPFFLPSVLLHRQLGHRGLSHSLAGLLIVSLMSLPIVVWWGWLAWLSLLLGYASHLALDACTKSGIPFFYPSKYRYHLLPFRLRFTTGSQAEDLLFPFLVMAVLLLLLRHLPYR